MTTDLAIQTRGLTKFYGHQRGIEDLDLDVRRGEVFGFLGPNGAGKTTTIRLLLGLLHPTRGTARLLDRDAAAEGVELRRDAGYIPGDLALYANLTGRELLGFLGTLRGGVPWPDVQVLAERFDLDLARHVHDLSKGNRQKLGVVQAFMHRPALLVLDEPTGGLDPLVQEEFRTLVRETVAEGRTVFLSSHMLSEVQETADRVAIVDDGHLVVVDTVRGLTEHAVRQISLDFPGPPPLDELRRCPGVTSARGTDGSVTCDVVGALTELLAVAVRHGVIDVRTYEPDLEAAFLTYVGGDRR